MEEYVVKINGAIKAFESGMKRDTSEGKPNFRLIPQNTANKIIEYTNTYISAELESFSRALSERIEEYNIIKASPDKAQYIALSNAMLQLAVEFNIFKFGVDNTYKILSEFDAQLEAGAKKYGDHNWQLGMYDSPEFHRAFESYTRHFYQCLFGQTDEKHWAAIIFNAMTFGYYTTKGI